MMKQKYTKPEISSVEFKMEQGYAASQGARNFLGSFESLSWEDIERDNNEVHEHNFFGNRTTGYFAGNTDNWD